MSVPLSDTRPFGVVLDYRPDADRILAWGPFATADAAARFAEFATAEIDPARVLPWQEAVTLPGVRLLDPVAELLTWRTSIALPQRAALAEEFAAALLAVDRVEWALAGQHAGADAAKLIRRMACLSTPDAPCFVCTHPRGEHGDGQLDSMCRVEQCFCRTWHKDEASVTRLLNTKEAK